MAKKEDYVFISLENISKEMNLHFRKTGLYSSSRVYGVYSDYKISIYIKSKRPIMSYHSNDNYLCIELNCEPIKLKDFQIANETLFSKIVKDIGVEDILIGDETFDNIFNINSQFKYYIISLLNENIRNSLLTINGLSDSIDWNQKRLVIYRKIIGRVYEPFVYQVIEKAINILTDVKSEKNAKKRLQKNVLDEKNIQIKKLFINTLGKNFSLDKDSIKIFESLLQHQSIDLQITVAQYLSKMGMTFLKNIIKEHMKREIFLNESDVLYIISIFAEKKYGDANKSLMQIYNETHNEKIKKNILQVFKNSRDQEMEMFILNELSLDSDLLLEKIGVLSVCGTVKSVEYLRNLWDDSINPITIGKIKEAIVQIQSRLGNVDTGWMSMTEMKEKEGAVSLNISAAEGSVSMVKKKRLKSTKKTAKKSKKKN